MTRRSFINKCALFVAGCQLGLQLNSKKPTLEINPEWVKAEYDIRYWSIGINGYQSIIVGPPPNTLAIDKIYWIGKS